MSTTFHDKPYYLRHWANVVEAICPKCGGVGLSKQAGCGWVFARFNCHHCQHQLHNEAGKWQGQVCVEGRRPCGRCGRRWLEVSEYYPNHSAVPRKIWKKRCIGCNTIWPVDVKTRAVFSDTHDQEPYFGLALHLVEPTRHGTLYAYNATQVAVLREYVQADIRKGTHPNGCYFSRLPAWIKGAKHRGEILRALDKMADRAITPTTPS